LTAVSVSKIRTSPLTTIQNHRARVKRKAESEKRQRRKLTTLATVALAIPLGNSVTSIVVAAPLAPVIERFTVRAFAERALGDDDTFLALFNKVQQTAIEKNELRKVGFLPLKSSNVSAIAEQEDDLIIRFHDASLYRYPNQGDLFNEMASALSPGRFVWNRLRRPRVRFEKIGALVL
jgi:hypothetical protein